MRFSKLSIAVTSLLGVAAFSYVVTAFRYRGEAGGFRKSISPIYWVDRMQGRDLFDPVERIWYKGNRERKEVALTIDDGPHPLSGLSLLKTLKEKNVIATFFVIGKQVDGNPDITRQMIADGHEVANHTYDHVRLNPLSREAVYDQIYNCDRAVARATGRQMTLFRPPGVQYNENVLSVVNQLDKILVHWTIGAKDFIGTTPEELPPDLRNMPPITREKVIEYVMKQLRPGAIILLHDNPITASAMPELIDKIKAQGYEFKSCKDMLASLPNPVYIRPNPACGIDSLPELEKPGTRK